MFLEKAKVCLPLLVYISLASSKKIVADLTNMILLNKFSYHCPPLVNSHLVVLRVRIFFPHCLFGVELRRLALPLELLPRDQSL